ncbi:VOC family protein [Nocardiopsis coralliicola]
MEQRLNLITLACDDLDAVRAFYRDSLGWAPLADVSGEIVFFQAGPGLAVAFFDRAGFADDVGGDTAVGGPAGITLACNVESPAEVDAAVAAVRSAGGRVVKEPQRAAFGGYHAYIADPGGVLWEVCHNPGWSVDDDGTVHLGPVE